MWWQQMEPLSILLEKLYRSYDNFSWPLRSPDLTAPDLFLWRYLKQRAFTKNKSSLADLKENILQEIRSILKVTLQAVMNIILERAILCEEEKNEGHLKDVIFHV